MITQKGKDLACFLALNGLLGLGGWIATSGFEKGQLFIDVSNNPTPRGYTKSLIFFLLPCITFGIWLMCKLPGRMRKKSFFWTILILFLLGVILDVLFGRLFLKFENPGSILGLKLPALDWCTGSWMPPFIPIEELFFYSLGFIAILLCYIWSDEVLFSDNKVTLSKKPIKLLNSWPRAILLWIAVAGVLFGVAYWIRSSIKMEGMEGKCVFPGYFLFLLITALIPSLICSRLAFHFVNFRALIVAWLFVMGISQFWEAGLAIPFQWWGYQDHQMMGLFLKAQCNLPIEAVLVWTLATWTTIMVYETILNIKRIKEGNHDKKVTVREALQGSNEHVIPLKVYYSQKPTKIMRTWESE